MSNTPSSRQGLALPLSVDQYGAVYSGDGTRIAQLFDKRLEPVVAAANRAPAYDELVSALQSIANSTCCGSCQEAALVARAALTAATAETRTVCEGCGYEIDPDCCGCGDAIKGHSIGSGHSPVPMGCECFRVSEPAKSGGAGE